MTEGSIAAKAPSAVLLSIPAAPELLGLTRVTAAAVASRYGFTFDDIEDLRLAVDELCFSLVGSEPREGRLQVAFAVTDSTLVVEAWREGVEDGAAQQGYGNELSEAVLDALVDDHGTEVGEKGIRVWLRRRSRSGS